MVNLLSGVNWISCSNKTVEVTSMDDQSRPTWRPNCFSGHDCFCRAARAAAAVAEVVQLPVVVVVVQEEVFGLDRFGAEVQRVWSVFAIWRRKIKTVYGHQIPSNGITM